MSLKNSSTISDYLEFDSTLNKAIKILKDEKDKNFKIAFLALVGINVGLRISDLINLTFEDIERNNIMLIETKTKKKRTIQFNEHIMSPFELFKNRSKSTTGKLFHSNQQKPFSTQYLNRAIKVMFGKRDLNVSTHSLRKTFGRRVWDNNQQTDTALIYLSEIFNHSSIAVTRRYLGIRQEQLKDIYMNL